MARISIKPVLMSLTAYAALAIAGGASAAAQDGFGCIGPGYLTYDNLATQRIDGGHVLVIYTPPIAPQTTPLRRTVSIPSADIDAIVCQEGKILIEHSAGKISVDIKTGAVSPLFSGGGADWSKPAINVYDARMFMGELRNFKTFVEPLLGWPSDQGFELHIVYYSVPLYDVTLKENHGLTHYTISRIVKNPPSGNPSSPWEIPLYSGATYEPPET